MAQTKVVTNKKDNDQRTVEQGDNLSWTEYILIHYRWVIVILFLLPMSVIYDCLYFARAWIIFKLASAPEKHSEKVGHVQKQVKQWITDGRKEKMCTARPGWQTISFRQPLYKSKLRRIQVDLVDVLKIDVEAKEVTVEPLVTMGQLTATLIPLGWTIPVLPELDDLTVGGLVNGTGIETSSHKYGLFQHICNEYEIVTADGEVLTCNKDQNPDFYKSIPWSYGTLGFLTSVKIQIIPASRFVKLEYFPVKTLEEMNETFREKTFLTEGNEFVEGLMFSKDTGVVMVGNMMNCAEPGKVNEIGRWFKPWFFKHVENFLYKGPGQYEYIPIRDYFHRHSRSIFWEIREIIPFGNNLIFRYFLGWMVPPKVSLLKLTQPDAVKKLYEKNHMIQDMLVPFNKFKESLSVFDKETGIYPLWLCPFKVENEEGLLNSRKTSDPTKMYVDIGAYGVPTSENFHAKETTRRIESFVRQVNGFQMLYADTYMTRTEFREMFDHSLYDRVRTKSKSVEAFPEVYDKVSFAARV